MGADGIEVTQQDGLDGATATDHVGDDVLANLLGCTIGRSCLLGGGVLGDGVLVRLTINGA